MNERRKSKKPPTIAKNVYNVLVGILALLSIFPLAHDLQLVVASGSVSASADAAIVFSLFQELYSWTFWTAVLQVVSMIVVTVFVAKANKVFLTHNIYQKQHSNIWIYVGGVIPYTFLQMFYIRHMLKKTEIVDASKTKKAFWKLHLLSYPWYGGLFVATAWALKVWNDLEKVPLTLQNLDGLLRVKITADVCLIFSLAIFIFIVTILSNRFDFFLKNLATRESE